MNTRDIEELIEIFGTENVVVFDEVTQMQGTVARIMPEKGFGFIKGEDNQDYFFHKSEFEGFFDDLVTDVDNGLKVGVSFDSIPSAKGLRAGNVKRLDGGIF